MPPTTYTQGYSPAVLKAHASRTAETSAAFLLPHIKPDAKILDVGCGPGTITNSLAKYVPQGSVLGIDYSSDVVQTAQSRAVEVDGGLPANVKFEQGSVYELAQEDDSFDIVYAHQMLLHLPEPIKALKEMRRVCKPGGLVAVREGDWEYGVIYPTTPAIELWKSVSEQIFRSIGAEPNAGRRLISWAMEAGFTPSNNGISYSSSNQTYGGQPDVRWWGEMWTERITGEWTQKALATGQVTQADIDTMVKDWLDWSQKPDSVFVIFCGEALLRK